MRPQSLVRLDKKNAPSKPPLCKGRWLGDSRDGGIVVVLPSPSEDNPSVSLTADSSPYTGEPLILPALGVSTLGLKSRGPGILAVGADVLIGPFRWCGGYRGPLGTAAPTEGPFLSIVKALGPSAPLIRHGFAVPPSPQRVEGFALAFPLPGGRCPRRGRMRVPPTRGTGPRVRKLLPPNSYLHTVKSAARTAVFL